MKDPTHVLNPFGSVPAAAPADPAVPAKRPTSAAADPKPADPKRHCPSEPALKVVRVSPLARLPVRGSALSAGFDLSASQPASIAPGARCVVKTGLKIAVPAGCYGRVAPRSGLAINKGVDVGAGVIDADYRGEVGVVLFNFGAETFDVAVGDRVAQLVLERICMADVSEVEELDDTERGDGGFGSTGVAQQ